MLRQYLDDTQAIFNYMKAEGFNPRKYRSILELGGMPESSLSCLLKKHNPYLLSFISSEDRLKKMGIKGAKGYIANNEIIYVEKPTIPLTTREEIRKERFYPSLENFQVLISTSLNDKTFAAAALLQDKFFGFCLHKDDKSLKFQIDRCHHLLEEIKASGQDDYEITSRQRSDGKVLYLVKKSTQINI